MAGVDSSSLGYVVVVPLSPSTVVCPLIIVSLFWIISLYLPFSFSSIRADGKFECIGCSFVDPLNGIDVGEVRDELDE